MSAEEDIAKQCELRESNILIPNDKKISDILAFHYPHLSVKELAICRQVIYTMNDFHSIVSPLGEVVAREVLYKRVYSSETEVRNVVESLIQMRVLLQYRFVSYHGKKRIAKIDRMLTFANRDVLVELIYHSTP